MIKLDLVKQIGIISMMFFSTGLMAQHVIYEDTDMDSENTIHFNFNNADYTKISNDDGSKTFIKKQIDKSEGTSPNRSAESNTFILKVILNFNDEEFHSPVGIAVFNEQGDISFAYDIVLGEVTMELAGGTYDILTQFSKIGLGGGNRHTVIKEMVVVNDSTVVEIDVEEAVNKVSIEFFDEMGVILQGGITDEVTGQMSQGTIRHLIYFEPANICPALGSFLISNPGEDPAAHYYINDVSERYSFGHSADANYFAGEKYFTKFETINGISGDVVISNNPDDWVHHTEIFQQSLLGEAADNAYQAVILELVFDGESYGLSGTLDLCCPINPEEGLKLWLNNPHNDDRLQVLAYHMLIESWENNPFTGSQNARIIGNSMMSTQDGGVQYGSGNSSNYTSYLANDHLIDETGNYQLLNIHPQFSFLSSQSPDMVVGNNTPISLAAYGGGALLTKYMGRYGEVRNTDNFDTQIEVKQDGNVVFSGEYIDFLSQSLPDNGDLEITYTTTNIEVDGLAGKNTVSIVFRANENDLPPTLLRLQFRDADDNVTDRFDSGTQGIMRIAAGDFQYNSISWFTGYYSYVEGNNVEVYYSLYDQNEWSELELTEYPEYFQEGYGDFYKASLEEVIAPEANSWFDVRIKCTDAAGNIQEQIVSPAFKIADIISDIEKISAISDIKIFPNPFTDQLTISLPESVSGDITLRITDILGKTIYSENKNMGVSTYLLVDGSGFAKGVYILSSETKDDRIAKKIVKK